MNRQIIIITTIAILFTFASIQYITESQKQQKYEQWKLKYGKQYLDYEDKYRFQVYLTNMLMINAHNSLNKSYKLAENKFMDLTKEEFQHIYLGPNEYNNIERNQAKHQSTTYPESIDHSSKLFPVKSQGQCDASWAFSAVGAFESYLIFTQDTKVALSEQQLIDCDPKSFSCFGGRADIAMDYLATYGAVPEIDYPYKGVDMVCKKPRGTYKANGRIRMFGGQEEVLEAVSKFPVSSSVDARNWQFYEKGIFLDCASNTTNQEIVIVGYDSNKNWKVRNSWGSDWGMEGYIWIAAGETCGILRRVDQVY